MSATVKATSVIIHSNSTIKYSYLQNITKNKVHYINKQLTTVVYLFGCLPYEEKSF